MNKPTGYRVVVIEKTKVFNYPWGWPEIFTSVDQAAEKVDYIIDRVVENNDGAQKTAMGGIKSCKLNSNGIIYYAQACIDENQIAVACIHPIYLSGEICEYRDSMIVPTDGYFTVTVNGNVIGLARDLFEAFMFVDSFINTAIIDNTIMEKMRET